jgi:hypothetical protein
LGRVRTLGCGSLISSPFASARPRPFLLSQPNSDGSRVKKSAEACSVRRLVEERIIMGLDNYIKYSRSDGSFWSFGLGSSGWIVIAPSNVAATLNTDTSVNPYYVLTFQNGEKRRFDKTTGNLIAIIETPPRWLTTRRAASRRSLTQPRER